MGYETTLLIYETTLLIGKSTNMRWFDKQTQALSDEYNYFMVYAQIDLSKAPAVYTTIESGQKMYFFDTSDGNRSVIKDEYGSPLYAHSAGEILTQLKDTSDDYRRYKWAIALLESMIETAGEDLHVLLFGH